MNRHTVVAVLLAAMQASILAAPVIAEEGTAVKISLKPVTISPGGAAEVVATVVIEEGYYLQANPTPGKYLLPTMLLFEPAGGVHAEGPVYPEGKPFTLSDDDFKFSGYNGTITIKVPIKASSKAVPGEVVMNGRLRYQPSTKDGFERERSLPVTLKVTVARAR